MVQQFHLLNAYLEDDISIIAKLSAALMLPFARNEVRITDVTSGQELAVTAVDVAYKRQVTLTGDFQTQLGTPGNWYTDDVHTRFSHVNANLYQLHLTLAAGNYQYKVAFDGVWEGVFPEQNVLLHVSQDNTTVTFSYVPCDPTTQQARVYDSINQSDAQLPTSSAGVITDLVRVTLAQAPDITHTLQLIMNDSPAIQVIPRNVLSNKRYIYTGDDLGATFSTESTSFRLWAPTASAVQVLLFPPDMIDATHGMINATDQESNVTDAESTLALPMQPADGGTWQITAPQRLENWYYLYQVTVHGQTQTAVDPYARALTVNATHALIVDLAKTNPPCWETDRHRALDHPVDAIIYEVHVRDFSIHAQSGMRYQGKYLAFTEDHTTGPDDVFTGIASLKELGITHVQLQPVAEFASVDETRPEQYNWGYDPRNYNVPEGAYATEPEGIRRITEFKQLVQSLHQSGLGVTLDVVYNHTFTHGTSDFDKIVPQYYYRTDYAGQYADGSGTGNELATERPMVQKFVRDSVKFWVQEYHVDGFRFDLMALLSIETMRLIALDLTTLYPDILLYGEPWTGNTSALPGYQLLTKGQQKNLEIGVFNDHLRNALSGSVFDRGQRGYATGDINQREAIKLGLAGSIDVFTAAPGETINYASSHDNLTLWDKIMKSNRYDSQADRIKMDMLTQAIVLTAQGVPFLQGGEEFLRTKGGNDNSYNAGDAVNQFDWKRKGRYRNVFDYYAELIQLRKNHPAFRMTTAEEIRAHLSLQDGPGGTLVLHLNDHAHGDRWKNILMIYNPTQSPHTLLLPAGDWTLVGLQGKIDEDGIREVVGVITVASISCTILYQDDK